MAVKELVIDCTGNSDDDSSSTNKARSSQQQQMRDRRNARKRLTSRSDASPAPGSIALRKGESSAAAAAASNSKKRSRALERRNERRRARQRGISPRSPDGGPRSADPRIGKPLPDLPSDEEQRQLKRIRNRKAMKDAVLHSTAWRYVRLDTAPHNLLPDRPDIALPFSTELNRPLEEFDPDSELASKCAISMSFGQAPALSLQSATHHEVLLPCCMASCVWREREADDGSMLAAANRCERQCDASGERSAGGGGALYQEVSCAQSQGSTGQHTPADRILPGRSAGTS